MSCFSYHLLRNSVTGYLSEKKPGFEKDRGSPVERHVIRWDIDRVARQASIYGLNHLFPTSQNNYFESFETFAPDTSSATKEFPKEFSNYFDIQPKSFADFIANSKESKEPKEFPWDIRHYDVSVTFQKLGRLAWKCYSRREGAHGPGRPAA